MFFFTRVMYCAFFIRVRVRFRVFVMHVSSTTRVRVRFRFSVCGYVYNLLHVIKIKKLIRDRLFLSSYVYVCACESVCMCV